ncbi:MAG: hypothetical protein WKF43_04280 [Acidimicrobiales bacterium]
MSIPATGGQPVAVRRHGFELVTTDGRVVIEAGPAGDTLVLVADGELNLVDGTGHARRLSRGQAGVLASDGTVSVDEVDEDEMAGDRWVAANTLLDQTAVTDGDALLSPSPSPDLEHAIARAPSQREVMRRRFTRAVAVAIVVLIIVLMFLLSDDDADDASVRVGARATSTSGVTTTLASVATTESASAREPVRARLDRRSGCVQRGNTLVARGTAENARPPAARYRIEVTVRTSSGRVFGQARDTVEVADGGAPVDWQITVPVGRSLEGTGAECEVTGVDTLPE